MREKEREGGREGRKVGKDRREGGRYGRRKEGRRGEERRKLKKLNIELLYKPEVPLLCKHPK